MIYFSYDVLMEYVIYCRRSSDEKSEKQTQSIPDQIKRCMEYANNQNPPLKIMGKPEDFSDFETIDEIMAEDNDNDINNRRVFQETRNLFIIKESKTGKIPGVRKKWRNLMRWIKTGKVKGLLSYSPDRQARNILEGGEIINFVDEDMIELKYTNFHFENTASGKMMLGIWFVFAKQYSDAISENVNRGNKETIGRGKALGGPKYGYRRREDGYYEPDPEKFDIMKQAFHMKIYEQKSDRIIAQWMNDQGRKQKRGDDYLEASGNKINKIWKDTFYYGLLCVKDYMSDQTTDNPYYKSLITKEEYEILADRRIDTTKTPIAKKQVKDEYEELRCIPRDMLKSPDGYSLTPNLPNKKNRVLPKLFALQKTKPDATIVDVVSSNLMRYGVKQKLSKHNGLEITGADIETAVLNKLQMLQVNGKAYEEYKEFMKGKAEELYQQTTEEINVLTMRINNIRSEMRKYIDKHMGLVKDKLEEDIYQNKKKELEAKINRLEKERDELGKHERNTYVEYEMFLDIMNKAGDYYKRGTYVQKATITSIFFSNMVLDDKKRLTIAVKPIFDNMFLAKSADDATRTRNQLLGRQGL